ncbi:helix-turn-helix domain-containing protein [Phenylobacterium sp. LjRoot219]|uniref:IclR family transcriptional regulator n=1 Tax=Phenylobacterium sp. LjRoot219 TaxID=3342283 RepID=UPI003ED05618
MSRSSPSAHRVAAALDFIAARPGRSFTLSDLARALRLSPATCHALLVSLVEVGYLYRASDKAYVLGPALLQIGRTAAEHASPLQIAKPEMRALADEFEAICSAFVRDQDEVIVRERATSAAHLGFSTPLGARLRLRAPFSASFYAWSPGEAEAWLDSSSPSPTVEQRDLMRRSMAFAREHGFIFNIRNPAVAVATPEETFAAERNEFPIAAPGELDPDRDYMLAALNAPVFAGPGRVAFVLGLMGFSGSVPGREVERIGRRLRDACDRLTAFIAGSAAVPGGVVQPV